jgi:hypothetical protein
MPSERDLNQLSAQIEDLVQRIEFIADPAVRANMVALLQSLMELHRTALARLTDLLSQEGEAGQRILNHLANDELFGGLLLLYELHPEGLEARVESAVQKMQEYFVSSGDTVELLGVDDGVVRIRVTGSAATDKTIEDLIYLAAPDVVQIKIERIVPKAQRDQLVQLEVNASVSPT